MNNIDVKKWKEFKIKEIFPKLVKGKCSNSTELIPGRDVPYIGAKKTENGVMFICEYNKNLISNGNCISFICQGEGSNGFCNYFEDVTIQSSSNVLGYNEKLNKYNGLFIVSVADLERFKWSFGRGRAPKLKDEKIKLPATSTGEPDWQFMEDYIKSLLEREKERVLRLFQSLISERQTLDISKWKEFKVSDIFEKRKIKKLSSIPEQLGDIAFISSQSTNNGIVKFCKVDPILIMNNAITVSTNGTNFECFYHDYNFVASSDVEVLFCPNLTKNIALFICAILKENQWKYSFGYKAKNNAVFNTVIKLPIDKNGNIDWLFMENYIKSLLERERERVLNLFKYL